MSRLIGFSGFGVDPPICPDRFIPDPAHTTGKVPGCRPDCTQINDPNLDPGQFMALVDAGCGAELDCNKVPDAAHCFCHRGPDRGRSCVCLDAECRTIVSATPKTTSAGLGVPKWALGLGAGLLISWFLWGRKGTR